MTNEEKMISRSIESMNRARRLQDFERGVVECNVPARYADSLRLYLTKGIEPGSFTRAVLENNFVGAIARMDPSCSAQDLRGLMQLVCNFLPTVAWGNRTNVLVWRQLRGLSKGRDLQTANQ